MEYHNQTEPKTPPHSLVLNAYPAQQMDGDDIPPFYNNKSKEHTRQRTITFHYYLHPHQTKQRPTDRHDTIIHCRRYGIESELKATLFYMYVLIFS